MDDPVLLSRLQFAITIMFHYIFPPMTIGLGVVLVALEGLWLKTKNDLYHKQAKFWTRIFGIIFALGVASGIVMEFQFGTNWADYSRCVGDIFGSPLAAEGIFAFFLESGFLAILLFGWDKVLHGRSWRPFQRHLDHCGQLLDADARRIQAGGSKRENPGPYNQLL